MWPVSEVKTLPRGECENITVTTADGRVFDLGKPGSLKFKIRLKAYRAIRALET